MKIVLAAAIALPLLGMALACGVLLSSCSTLQPAVDSIALLEPLQGAWDDVAADVERGIADALADGDISEHQANSYRADLLVIGAALDSGERSSPGLFMWSQELLALGVRGVQDRLNDKEIGDSAAISGQRLLSEFADGIARLKGGPH